MLRSLVRSLVGNIGLGLLIVAVVAAPLAAEPRRPRVPPKSRARDDSTLLNEAAAATASPDVSPRSPSAASRTPLAPAVLQTEPAVRAAGWLTIDHSYATSNPWERDLRRPTIVQPTISPSQPAGYTLLPVQIATTVVADGSGDLILPCPRDILDQLHAGCSVSVTKASGADQEKAIPHTAKIIYSDPGPTGGYVNPFLHISLNNEQATGPLTVRTLHWITQADYGRFDATQWSAQLDEETATRLHEAIRIAGEIEYDAELQVDEVEPDATRGDCTVKASAARRSFRASAGSATDAVDNQAVEPYVEVLEGYRFRLPQIDTQTGGCHFQNLALLPQGALMVDATGVRNYYLGPPRGFITTAVGGQYNVKEMGDRPGVVRYGSNLGFYRGFKSYGKAKLSTPTFGDDQAALAKLAASKPIAAYAAALWRMRYPVSSPSQPTP